MESEITTIVSSIYVSTSLANSGEGIVTIVQSVTAFSVETKTSTAVLTATVAPTATNASISTENKSSNKGISHGAIAGIVVGVVCGALIFGAMLLWFFGFALFCIPGRKRDDNYDDEKSIRDDISSIHHGTHLGTDSAIGGLTGFGRTPAYLYNADELSIGYGTRRFSQGSLPDAAGGSESGDSSKSNKGGLRVINPDFSDNES